MNSELARVSFGDDRRGTILIIGLVAGTVLAGALYFLTGVGQGVAWRQSSQNIADAVGFHDSVLQARGMNVIVLMNMAMAVVMAILVTFRMIEMLLFLGLIIVTGLCAIPPTSAFFCPLVPRVASWQLKLAKKDKPLSERVAKVCAGINVAERITATVVPPLAAVVASVETSVAYGTCDPGRTCTVTPAITFNTSLTVPPRLKSVLGGPEETRSTGQLVKNFYKLGTKNSYIKEELQKCFKKAKAPSSPKKPPSDPKPPSKKEVGIQHWEYASQQRMGIPFSLPVMNDRINRLCSEASRYQDFVFATIANVISGQGADSASGGLDFMSNSAFSDIKAQLVGAAPSLFCLPATAGHPSVGEMARQAIEDSARQKCQEAEKRFDEMPKEERRSSPWYAGGGSGLSWRDVSANGFNRKKCTTETKKEHQDRQKEAYRREDEARKALDTIAECVKPAKVWEVARNGNLFMVSWGFGLKKAKHGGGWVSSQSEMYFDCPNKPWIECDANAMWRPLWKATLKRDGTVAEMAGDAAALMLASGISHGAQRFLGDLLYKNAPVIGTDAKYGNVFNGPRDQLQELLYRINPLSSTDKGVTNFH